jgi:hypothetical protein
MTLEETVLQKLASRPPQTSDRQTIGICDDAAGWLVSLSVDRGDELSCALWEMSQSSPRPPSESGTDLKGWSEKVVGQVRGLLEPLAVIEIDAQRNEALLRSNQPTARENDRYYYEVLLKGGGHALVRRYRGSTEAGRRTQVPFTLTHEAIAKLAADLTF